MTMAKVGKDELEKAVEILEAFNRAGVSYRICEDGSFDFCSDKERERAQEIIKEIENKN